MVIRTMPLLFSLRKNRIAYFKTHSDTHVKGRYIVKKRILSFLLCVLVLIGICPANALAASSEEEALGEIDIYSGGTKMTYLSINGRNRELVYTYYNYVDSTGQTKQIPAYCVNPDIEGVPQTVAPGESIKYMADEIGTDPKAVGIVAHGYPTRSLEELHLENAEQAYYATKMALWCYLLSNWDINDLKVNSSLSGVELQRAQKILAAAKDIYVRGTRWNEVPQPRVTCLPDRDTAYEVTIDGKTYKQQIFTFWSETWICNYRVDVAFALPDEVPEGTRIVDLSNRDITFITTEDTGNGFAGKFKVLYPADQVEGKTGSVRLSFRTDVYKYGIFYATCMETDEYGQLQDYLVDTDPTTEMRLSAYSNYEDGGTVIDNRTKLKILKLETGTKLPLSGALFEVVDPEGATVGVFSTDDDGEIELPLTLEGNYTVIERAAPPDHLLSEEPAQNVKVEYGETATLTFYNAPYGNLEVRKVSDTGAYFTGRAFGKHKLCPLVSPHKTVEGLIGGLITCIVLNLLAAFCYEKVCAAMGVIIDVNFLRLILISPFASLISVLGDLSFSMIKRQFQIKDFGKIMPGHGGVLDRFDSVLFTLPFIYATTLCFPVCQIVA